MREFGSIFLYDFKDATCDKLYFPHNTSFVRLIRIVNLSYPINHGLVLKCI